MSQSRFIKSKALTDYRPVLTGPGGITQFYAQLKKIFAENGEYQLLAEPIYSSGKIDWYTTLSGTIQEFSALSDDKQQLVKKQFSERVSDLLEGLRKQNLDQLAGNLRIALEGTTVDNIYRVDDKIVLIHWGFLSDKMDYQKAVFKHHINQDTPEVLTELNQENGVEKIHEEPPQTLTTKKVISSSGKKRLWILLALLLLLLLFVIWWVLRGPSTLSIQVVDSLTKTPIEGADVLLETDNESNIGVTDQFGNVLFEGLFKQDFLKLEINAKYYQPSKLDSICCKINPVELKQITLTFQIFDKKTQKSLEGAQIEITSQEGTKQKLLSDRDGIGVFRNVLYEEKYQVQGNAENYMGINESIQCCTPQNVVPLIMEPLNEVKIQVLNSVNNEPVSNAKVTMKTSDSEQGTTNSKGYVSFKKRLPTNEKFKVEILHPNYDNEEFNLTCCENFKLPIARFCESTQIDSKNEYFSVNGGTQNYYEFKLIKPRCLTKLKIIES
ncbi:MAG: hypothetical protein HQM12_17415, partial [SAR324 cluster bacterium]|nr:hypothetical protein [SAR324 cluster bacterium]